MHRHKPNILPGSNRRPPFSQPTQLLASTEGRPIHNSTRHIRASAREMSPYCTILQAVVEDCLLHAGRGMIVAVSSSDALQSTLSIDADASLSSMLCDSAAVCAIRRSCYRAGTCVKDSQLVSVTCSVFGVDLTKVNVHS